MKEQLQCRTYNSLLKRKEMHRIIQDIGSIEDLITILRSTVTADQSYQKA